MKKEILFSMESPYRDTFRIWGYRFSSGKKSLAVIGALRGDEVHQQLVCAELISRLRVMEEQGHLIPGHEILVVPSANPFSTNIEKRFWAMDNTDINRMFPGYDLGETTQRIAHALRDFKDKWEIPTQISVLSHVTTQMQAVREGAPLSMFFQSIAGTQAACEAFGVDEALLKEAYDLAKKECYGTGMNKLYFETGQGSEMSIDCDEGADEMTLEGRTYGFARSFEPFMINNVTGFIGPETIYDGKEMIRGNLEDHFMAKIIGLPMGMAPCFTNHTGITQDDQEIACLLLNSANCNDYMGVPMGDDVMLAYQDVSFHDDNTMRELSHRKPAPEFHKWAIKMGILDEDGKLTERAGDASMFFAK